MTGSDATAPYEPPAELAAAAGPAGTAELAAAAGPEDPARDPREPRALRLIGLEWVRIQLVLRFREPAGMRGGGAVSFALARERSGGPAARMTATRSWRADGEVAARFNVMLGPGQDPLAPGTWRLEAGVASGPGGRIQTVAIEDPARLAGPSADATFPTPRGDYIVAVRPAPHGGVQLSVSLETRAGARSAPPRRDLGLGSLGRRLARWARRAAFGAAVAGLRRLTGGRRPAVLFTSRTRPALGGNLAAVHDRMVARGLDREVALLRSFKADFHERTSLRERLEAPWRLARPDVIVIDDYHPLVHGLRDLGRPVIQLWHASGVVKTILYSRIGKPGGPDPWSRDYKHYSHAIVNSELDVPHFAEAFGIPEDRVVATGVPRIDRFVDQAAREAGREAALAAFPQARGRRVILLAPTFRGTGRNKTYDLEALDYPALHELCVEKDAVFIIRLHPRLRRPLGIPEALRDRLLDGSGVATDAPDILFATDLLVTDYSSIIFEFATLDRPMLFFAPDLDEFREQVDFYVPYEELVPGRIVRTGPALVDAIRREDFGRERLAAFRHRYLAHVDGKATDRVIDELILPGLRRR